MVVRGSNSFMEEMEMIDRFKLLSKLSITIH